MDTVKCTLKTHDDAILTLRLEIVTQILDFDQVSGGTSLNALFGIKFWFF